MRCALEGGQNRNLRKMAQTHHSVADFVFVFVF
jgi:hypothetical protein